MKQSFRKKFRRPIAFKIMKRIYRLLGYQTSLIIELNFPYSFGNNIPPYLVLDFTRPLRREDIWQEERTSE